MYAALVLAVSILPFWAKIHICTNWISYWSKGVFGHRDTLQITTQINGKQTKKHLTKRVLLHSDTTFTTATRQQLPAEARLGTWPPLLDEVSPALLSSPAKNNSPPSRLGNRWLLALAHWLSLRPMVRKVATWGWWGTIIVADLGRGGT